MKKVLVLFAAALCAFAILSCSKKEAAPAEAAPAAEAGTQKAEISGDLLVWMDNDDWANAVLAAFKQKHPNVAVKYENVGNVDSRAKVSLDGPAGIGPDVFLMPHDHISNALNDGILEPFSAEDQARYAGFILDASMKTCTSDGTLYALPISTENIAFFYNKDLLGDTPVPKSFEEVKAFADKYNDNAKNKYALRWQVDDAYHNYFFLAAYGMKVFGPDMNDYHHPGFDSPEALKGIQFHSSLKKYYPVKTTDATYDATIAAFQRGEVPFTITGPWAIGDTKKNGVNFGVTKLPTIEGQQPRCFSGNIICAVSSYSKNMDAAFAFADFLASVEGATIQFDKTGKMAAYKDVSGIPGLKDDPYCRGIMEQAPYADPMPTIPEVNQMWDALKALFTFTWDGEMTPQQAQAKAMSTYDTALELAGKKR